MGTRTHIYMAFCASMSVFSGACAPDPSLVDPYAENDFFWPYESEESAAGSIALEEASLPCHDEEDELLGEDEEGRPLLRLKSCEPSPEGEFPICAHFSEDAQLQALWAGANGFAVFVTEPQAVIPMAPGTPVADGETFWSIGPVDFPSDGFPSPLTYQDLPAGMEDVSADHGGPTGGATLEPGRCYKITVVNTAFRRASVIVGWE